jgi:hypothetical protein
MAGASYTYNLQQGVGYCNMPISVRIMHWVKDTKLVNKYRGTTKTTWAGAFVAVVVAVAGYMAIQISSAATYAVHQEAESGAVTPNASVVQDLTASSGAAVRFGSAALEPSGVKAITGGTNIALRWNTSVAPAGNSIKGYAVYRNGQRLGATTINASDYLNPTGTRYYDSAVVRGQSYQYQVAAIDSNNAESGKSAIVSATHPLTTASPIQVTYDTTGAPDLAAWTQNFLKPTIDIWYPKIVDSVVGDKYAPPTTMRIEFDENITQNGLTYFDNRVVLNPKRIRADPANFGTSIHELVHVATYSDGATPLMLLEGGADWFQEYMYGAREPRKPTTTEAYEDGYAPSSYFIQWIMETQNKPNFLRDFGALAKSSGTSTTYDSVRLLTGKPVQQMWYEMTGRKISFTSTMSLSGNLCANRPKYGTANGTLVQIAACSNAYSQHWTHMYKDPLAASGVGALRSSRVCLDVINSGTAENTQVQMWSCNNTAAQDWIQEANGTLRNPNSNKCLQPLNGSKTATTQLVIATCTGSDAQRWTVPKY